MDLVLEHVVDHPLERVEARVLDRATLEAMPGRVHVLREARLLELRDEGDIVTRSAYFQAERAWLPAAALRLVPRLAWIERVVWSRTEHAGTFTIEPDVPEVLRRRVACGGRYALRATSRSSTTRRVEASLFVRAPIVGALAESSLAAMLRSYFDDEAALLAS